MSVPPSLTLPLLRRVFVVNELRRLSRSELHVPVDDLADWCGLTPVQLERLVIPWMQRQGWSDFEPGLRFRPTRGGLAAMRAFAKRPLSAEDAQRLRDHDARRSKAAPPSVVAPRARARCESYI